MNRVIHFEFGAREPERCARFFEQVFGWTVSRWNAPQEYWLATTGPNSEPGINGGILKHHDAQPRTVNTIGVDNLDDYAARVVAHGGQVVVPRMAIPGVGWLAYCLDTEGNLFGIHQADPSVTA